MSYTEENLTFTFIPLADSWAAEINGRQITNIDYLDTDAFVVVWGGLDTNHQKAFTDYATASSWVVKNADDLEHGRDIP